MRTHSVLLTVYLLVQTYLMESTERFRSAAPQKNSFRSPRGSFGGRSGSFGIVLASFGVRSGVVRGSFGGRSAVVRGSSISKLPKNASGASAGARVLAARRRTCSLEGPSFALTFKFSEAPQALRANFFARTGRFCVRLARSKVPQTRFWKPKRLDFRGFSRYPCFSFFFFSSSRVKVSARK